MSIKDLVAVYDAYLSLKSLGKSAGEFLGALQDKENDKEEGRSKLAARATSVVVAAEAALGKTRHALTRLEAEHTMMATHETRRGNAFDTLSEIEKLLSQKKKSGA